MYGMGFDGADDALGVLAAAAGAPAPAAAPAVAGGAPVLAFGAHVQEDFAWLAGGHVAWLARRERGARRGARVEAPLCTCTCASTLCVLSAP